MEKDNRFKEGSVLLILSIGIVISAIMSIQTNLILWNALDSIFFGGLLIFDYKVLKFNKFNLYLGMLSEIIGITQLMTLI